MTRWLFWKPNWLRQSKLLRKLIGNMKRYCSRLAKLAKSFDNCVSYFFTNTESSRGFLFNTNHLPFCNSIEQWNLRNNWQHFLITIRSPADNFSRMHFLTPGILNTAIVIDSLLTAYDASLIVIIILYLFSHQFSAFTPLPLF